MLSLLLPSYSYTYHWRQQLTFSAVAVRTLSQNPHMQSVGQTTRPSSFFFFFFCFPFHSVQFPSHRNSKRVVIHTRSKSPNPKPSFPPRMARKRMELVVHLLTVLYQGYLGVIKNYASQMALQSYHSMARLSIPPRIAASDASCIQSRSVRFVKALRSHTAWPSRLISVTDSVLFPLTREPHSHNIITRIASSPAEGATKQIAAGPIIVVTLQLLADPSEISCLTVLFR